MDSKMKQPMATLKSESSLATENAVVACSAATVTPLLP